MVTVYPRRNKHDGSTETNCSMTSDAEPTAAKNSQSVVGVSQRAVEKGNPNKDSDSKASSDQRAKRAEKLAALEKDIASK